MIDWKKNNYKEGPDLPDSVLSLHVDHDLQSDAVKMASAANAAATRFKVTDHAELRIPWGSPPFPSRPGGEGGSNAVESVARPARYRLMFDAMVRRRVRVLAMGHHADDQVETVLMRLGSGSTVLGLGGMRPVRRFGMSLGKREGDFGWFGLEGMDRWIVRPLLDVPKVSAALLPPCWRG
jgi:tRNA(Ile)-lysidine synthase TilS/MesJ